MKNLNILVTGGGGYVGSVLIPNLVADGHKIKCLDRFFFGTEYLSSKQFENNVELIRDDVRWFDAKILRDVDVVLDLAALSNDPVGELNPQKTFEINHLGRSRVAKLAKETGVPQYILPSSASVYGQQDQIVNEDSQVNPITAYSKANHKAEIDALALNDDKFSTTVLRFSSIYGISPRMRFDLAVNSMVLDFFNTGKITVMGRHNRRPFLNIKDAVRAYQAILKSPKRLISGQIFNIGSDDQNYAIYDLAREIREAIGKNCDIDAKDSPDKRSYIASFKKIVDVIGFRPMYGVKEGSIEIHQALKDGTLKFSDKMITLKWYKKILEDPLLSESFSIDGKIL